MYNCTTMARKTKTETEQTRSLLLDAARREFAERGVSGTSLEQIAKTAGLTRGAVYWHFTNKVDLFLALRNDVMMPLIAMIEALLNDDDGRDPLQTIEHCLLMNIDLLESDPIFRETFEIMISKCEYVGEFGDVLRCAIDRSVDAARNSLVAAYQRAHASGAMRPSLDPVEMANDTYAFRLGLIKQWIGCGADNGFRARAQQMIHTHVALRRAEPPAK